MQSVGILVVSCDKNEWLLNVFFEQFKRFWPQCPCNIYLSMECKSFQYQGIEVINILCEEYVGWCERVKKALQKMQEDYVLIMLDDFIIEEPVNEHLLKDLFYILRDNKLNNIILTPVINEKNYSDCQYEQLNHRTRFGRYKTSLQCGIWAKNVLENLLKDNENAWEFEIFGNIRSFLVEDLFYALRSVDNKPIVYNDGFFVVQGRVNVNEKNRLEKKLNKYIDIGEAVSFSGQMIRDDIKFLPRVIRRLKIIEMYILYRIMYMFKIKK